MFIKNKCRSLDIIFEKEISEGGDWILYNKILHDCTERAKKIFTQRQVLHVIVIFTYVTRRQVILCVSVFIFKTL